MKDLHTDEATIKSSDVTVAQDPANKVQLLDKVSENCMQANSGNLPAVDSFGLRFQLQHFWEYAIRRDSGDANK